VPLHGGNQTRIMSVLPLHIVRSDQIAPLAQDPPFVKQQTKERDPLGNRLASCSRALNCLPNGSDASLNAPLQTRENNSATF
jgi:hypothetical protein